MNSDHFCKKSQIEVTPAEISRFDVIETDIVQLQGGGFVTAWNLGNFFSWGVG